MPVVSAAFVAFLSATPSTPAPDLPPDDLVTPGPWGFAVVAFIGVAVVLLLIDMMRRIRRARYRSEIAEELDAEQAAEESKDDAPEGETSAGAAKDGDPSA